MIPPSNVSKCSVVYFSVGQTAFRHESRHKAAGGFRSGQIFGTGPTGRPFIAQGMLQGETVQVNVAFFLRAGRAFHPTSPVSGRRQKHIEESDFPVGLAGFNGRGTSASLQSGRDDQRLPCHPLILSSQSPCRQNPAAVRAAWVQQC